MDFGSKLEELNLTRDEMNRIGEALKDEQFRALLSEYAAEISSPENRRRYEEEIRRLEEDRGVQVQFIHPTAHHVLKSRSASGKCFINICSDQLIEKPRSEAATDGHGRAGHRWRIPFSLTPGRPDRDSAGNPCVLYDAVFHPDALRMAETDARFMKLIHSTAIGGIQDSFHIRLDGDQIKRLKMKYKGVPHPAVIRRPIPGHEQKHNTCGDALSFPYPDPDPPKKPHYTVKYRSVVDLQDYRCSRDSGPGVRPSAIIITVDVPLLTSVQDADVRVEERRLVLEAQKADYRLDVPLSYPVDEDKGEAKFNKTRKQLTITLPVRPAQVKSNAGDEEIPQQCVPDTEDPPSMESAEPDHSHHKDIGQLSDSSSNTKLVGDVHHHTAETAASFPDHPPSSEKQEDLESFEETQELESDAAEAVMENPSSDPPPPAAVRDPSACAFQNSLWFDLD